MYRILSVDDEPINQIIVEELFGDLYDVHLASSGEECLKSIDDIQPQLILLDVSMSGMDGYTTSLLLKEKNTTRNIPVIFVSARSTLEDKVKGYEAGGHDYVTKPFDHSELTLKIDQLICNTGANTALSQNSLPHTDVLASSTRHAMTDLASISDFFNHTVQCTTPEALADLLLEFCKKLNLASIIQLRTQSKTLNISFSGQATPLESSLFKDALAKNRFFDFGTHTIISYPQVSLLIKNMPVENPEHYEQSKRFLEVLMAGVESRLTAINCGDSLQKSYGQLFAAIKRNMQEFDLHDQKIKAQNISIIENLSRQIKNHADELGLNAAQTDRFQGAASEAVEKLNKLFYNRLSIDEQLEIINNSLQQIITSQNDSSRR